MIILEIAFYIFFGFLEMLAEYYIVWKASEVLSERVVPKMRKGIGKGICRIYRGIKRLIINSPKKVG